MKRFILYIIYFSIPIILLMGYTKLNYSISGGDLNRLGKISVRKDYRSIFKNEMSQEKAFTNFSELNSNDATHFDIVNFGDSYSEQEGYSFLDYLSRKTDFDILNFNPKAYQIDNYNPVQYIYHFLQANQFQKFNAKYVILQSSERSIIDRCNHTDFNYQRAKFDLPVIIEESIEHEVPFGVNTLKFPFNSLMHKFNDRAFFTPVYQVDLEKELFSGYNDLLFYKEDLDKVPAKNDTNNINLVNSVLNQLALKLKEQDLKLIVIICPDKYDLYVPYIKDPSYPSPLFYDLLSQKKKEYTYINTKNTLDKLIKHGTKDVYLYDDTHWSPIASKKVANEIISSLNN